jgi:hypothetical protein
LITEDCVGAFVLDVSDEGNSPLICLSALPSLEDCAVRDNDGCFVCVVDVDFVLVKDCNVVCIDKLGDAEERVAFNSWHNVYILCRVAYTVMEFVYVACLFHSPLGMQKILSDSHPVAMKVFLSLSFWVPMPEVAPLSAMAEGMDPLRIPSLKSLMLLTCSL